MTDVDRLDVLARYVIRRCPECHGQAHDSSVVHFTDCPNTYAAFVPEEALVPWPDTDRRTVDLIRRLLPGWGSDEHACDLANYAAYEEAVALIAKERAA
jgi:hypothetical protein